MNKNQIIEIYGTDYAAMARRLAQAAGLAGMIGSRQAAIGLKPNLVLANPAEGGATTHPQLAEGLILYLKEAGFGNIAIIEGAWVGDSTPRAFSACGYEALAKKYGVRLIDTQRDSHRPHDCAGLEIAICNAALAVDFMINLPVLKGHCQTLLTCALKNNKGVIPNAEKRRFHALGLHRPIAHLNTRAKNDFILVDAICGDLDFEEGGNPVQANRLFCAADPVLCDAFAASQLGYTPEEIEYIPLAEQLGVGSARLSGAEIINLTPDGAASGAAAAPSRKARRVAGYINEQAACSACYAALTRALTRLEPAELNALPSKISIGQRVRGGALGVGRCASGCAAHLKGCPPTAADILEFLRGQLPWAGAGGRQN